ncbi:MAG: CotH kinase family protein [Prolixibacteraceae bacterium]|nr:CotH kinase family protein [Prolixibacteraceae bacterium]
MKNSYNRGFIHSVVMLRDEEYFYTLQASFLCGMNKRVVGIFFMIAFFVLLYINPLNAQLHINEFMASNTGIVVDPDYDESADWLELYNSGENSVSLLGYFLTDNFSDLYKWQITMDIEIAPGGFLIIWADGMDAGLHTSFKISASGEELALVSPAGVIVDSLRFNSQKPDVSMGREYDGATSWVFYTEPTPGTRNRGDSFDGIVKSRPSFSQTGGIYHSPLQVEVSSIYGGTVRYTLDGSEPDESSSVANSPLTLNRTTVVRARIFRPGEIPGPVVTHTYFIDPSYVMGTLPVVCISTNPDNFWDEDDGIYVQDYKPDWEIPVNIELFENDGSDRAAFNLTAGVKVNGLYSWKLPQKMLGVYFRKKYGAGKLDYPIIFEKDRKRFDSFALRASGSDWTYTLFRDGLAQNATYEYTDLDNSGFRACVVYVNGEYLGIHNIREKIDEDYAVQNHSIAEGNVYMVENENYAESGGDEALEEYDRFIELVEQDLSVQENWDAVINAMDIENFTDLIVTEVWDGNTSIDHNVMAWKPKNSGKWRWILMDLDRGFFNPDEHLINFYINQRSWPFRQLIQNTEYLHYFGKKLADHLFTTYHPERVKALIDYHALLIDAEIPRQVDRWEGTTAIDNYGRPLESYEYWLGEVEDLREYAEERRGYLLEDLTDYGFSESVPITVASYPEGTGRITFNGLEILVPVCMGEYPGGESIKLVAEAKPGHRFLGWSEGNAVPLIEQGAEWKYNDSGNDEGTDWSEPAYDDGDWDSGYAELGYGDGDETTVVDYGGDADNKHITTYFRKKITIGQDCCVQKLAMKLKSDDGAVVYINGNEVLRFNMPDGDIGFQTRASSAVGNESDFRDFYPGPEYLLPGENIIAVEIHQTSPTSSDISFDLELSAVITSLKNNLFSTDNEIKLDVDGEIYFTAVFESDGSCVIPSDIISEVILSDECSHYVAQSDVTISASGKLVIEKGVEIWMPPGASVEAYGPVIATGTEAEPVIFRANPETGNKPWGIINIVNASDTSRFENVIIEDASEGDHPVRETAAISAFHSVVVLDSVTIENVFGNPILGRYSDISLTNSRLHSSVTGDLINVKYGNGYINNCDFYGNDKPDTDAIDYDDVENGVIKNCRIHNFHGLNSDAIDIGERAQNILIDSVFVYNITDKGVSVGQQSSAIITNSVFTNCNLGAGLKDSCRVTIDHCTYYGNKIAVACYEKNPGDAGGNALVTNSILSNAYDSTFFCDNKSTVEIRYSASDNNRLPDGANNLFADPAFSSPAQYDFSLLDYSRCIEAGTDGNMGAVLPVPDAEPMPVICQIAYLTEENVDMPEFFAILNPSSSRVDFGGWKITDGVTFEFPPGAAAGAGELVYVTGNASHPFWNNRAKYLYEWVSGRLADEGEAILLETASGIVVDGFEYNNKAPWPEFTDATKALSLNDVNVDNHFGENWSVMPIELIVSVERMLANESSLTLYPNPATGWIIIDGMDEDQNSVDVFSIRGERIKHSSVSGKTCRLDISELNPGLYLVRAGNRSARLIVEK